MKPNVLTSQLKKVYKKELQIDTSLPWVDEWSRTTQLEMEIIEKFNFDGIKLILENKNFGDLFELGDFPKESPWYNLNNKSMEEAVLSIFAPIKIQIPELTTLLTTNCISIFCEKTVLGWNLHYMVKKRVQNSKNYYTILTGGEPLQNAQPNSSLCKYNWTIPQELIELYEIHNGFGEIGGYNILRNESIVILSDIIIQNDTISNNAPEDYSFDNLLVFTEYEQGFYQCYKREDATNDTELKIVDWDEKTWEIYDMYDLYSFIDDVIANVNDLDEYDEYDSVF